MKTNNIEPKIAAASISLADFVNSALEAQVEVGRVCLSALALINAGVLPRGALFSRVGRYITGQQQGDGGWNDVKESALSIKLLSLIDMADGSVIDRGNEWLRLQRKPEGGWGRSRRDISRIPVSGLLFHLLPEFSDSLGVKWLKEEWGGDLTAAARLTYKGGFFLLGLAAAGSSASQCPLIGDTVDYLVEEQNEDGGFAPWKGHPIGSEPWSTGIVLMGMLKYSGLVKKEVIEKAVNWLAGNQLPNGFWPYHYMEEGSSFAYMGLVEAVRYLSGKSK